MLTIFSWSNAAPFQEENNEKISDTKIRTAGHCQLSVLHGGGGICAAVALAMMLVGAMGMKIVPADYFGVVERFSVFAATGFNAALGIHLFCMKPKEIKE